MDGLKADLPPEADNTAEVYPTVTLTWERLWLMYIQQCVDGVNSIPKCAIRRTSRGEQKGALIDLLRHETGRDCMGIA